MQQLLWNADGGAEGESFVLRRRRLFPLRHWSPVEFSPVNVIVDGRVLEERLEFLGVVVSHLEESFECPDAGAFFFEELDDCFSFPLVGGGGMRR